VTRVLVVDDEPAIREAVRYALEREGFAAVEATDGEAALDRAREAQFDVVILDLMLPGISGLDVCRMLRAESAVPIVMLTSRSGEVDRVVGLELGADDYVVKPFSMAELVSRVRAILRRRALDRQDEPSLLRVGGVELDRIAHRVVVDGEEKRLTTSEFRLLELLAGSPDRVFTRRDLIRHLWESEHVGNQRACDTHVVNLRRKIEADPRRPQRLLTVRGVGYKLVAS
jgi:two-component system, OmpR family, response regulator RegX3